MIDDTTNTLAIPLVSFNPDVVVDQLMKISEMTPAERTKPVGAIVKGMGGGKTRAFEEIRRRLMVREKVLVIGITFNIEWSYNLEFDNWIEVASKKPSLSYALSVISRMASILFEKDFREIVNLMREQIDSLPNCYRT